MTQGAQAPSSFLNAVRYFNKYVLNHFTLLFAGSKLGPFSKLIHKGRKSGRMYKTPVVATYVDDKIIIPLSYGDQVDWLRNILAANGCQIIYRRSKMVAENPKVLPSNEVLPILPEKRRQIFERFKLEKFLCMKINNG
jgi:deazaflavin-dependent oxidoreductase (nitroreductase family)